MPVKQYSSSEVNQYELSARLLWLMETYTSYTLTQINGQRIFKKAPHAWNGPEPPRTCEVFIGRIPHDCFEDTLVPLFFKAGELFEFRLMINFSGWNRGYAFAMYATEAEASSAIRLFNNHMIRPSWQLGVCPSINNCRIFISRIPPTTPSAEIVRLLYALTDEVQEVRVRRSAASCAAIAEYRSHRGAAMARKVLVAAAAAVWGAGARPAVDWSLPQSPQLLRQYREIGYWCPERGVEIRRAEEVAGTASPTAGSYTLERWPQARRLRMIQEAQRNAALQHNQRQAQARNAGLYTSNAGFVDANAGLVGASAGLVTANASFSTAYAGLATAHDWSNQSLYGTEHMSPMSPLNAGALRPDVWGAPDSAPPQPAAPQSSASQPARDFNPWTARHPLEEFMTPPKNDE